MFKKAKSKLTGKVVSTSILLLAGIVSVIAFPAPAKAWLKVCNRTPYKMDVAVGYYDRNDNRHSSYNNGWLSKGWWSLDQAECVQVYPHELWRRNNHYYVYAKSYVGGRILEIPGSSNFCIQDGQKFTLYQGEYLKRDCGGGNILNSRWARFDEIKISGRTQNYTYNITY